MISKAMKLTADILSKRFSEIYTKITVNGRECYKLDDGRVISIGRMNSYGAFVVEYADSIEEAKLNRFEDGDLFDANDMSAEEILSAMQREIAL